MAEGQIFDPFAQENLAPVGGLWDGKTVTVTQIQTRVDWLKKRVGEELIPVIDKDTQKPAFRNVLAVSGIADGEEKEREETYSAGGLIPSPDGKSFIAPEGRELKFHPKSELGKFGAAIRAGGFDTAKLVVNGVTDFTVLVGARFTFAGVAQLDQKGQEKKNAKGYTQQKFYPRQFHNYRSGAAAQSPVTDELKAKATAAVLAALEAAEGKTLTRAALVGRLSSTLNGSPDTNAIIGMVIRDEFHVGQAWARNGSTYTLAA